MHGSTKHVWVGGVCPREDKKGPSWGRVSEGGQKGAELEAGRLEERARNGVDPE